MPILAKSKFNAIIAEANAAATVGEKMVIIENLVNSCDLNLIGGKNVEDLRKISYRYARMWAREQDGVSRVELPYAG